MTDAALGSVADPARRFASRVADGVEGSLAPLDGPRRWLLALTMRVPLLASLVRARDRRLAALSTIGVAFALTLSLLFPAVLFAVSPIVLGVPHVASDLRYLVLRRRLPRFWKWTVLGTSAVLVGVRIAQEITDLDDLLLLEVLLGSAWLAFAAITGAAVAGRLRRAVPALAVVAALTWMSLARPFEAVLLLTHVHNLVALALWTLLFRRRRVAAVPALTLVALGVAVIVSGAGDALTAWSGGARALGVEFGEVATWLVPGFAPALSARLVVAYVFLQAVHYSAWLGWIPQEDVRGEGTLTFRMTGRALVRDFGVVGLALIVLGVIAVVGFAFVDLLATRDMYLSVAAFHGYLELAMLAYLVTAGPLRPAVEAEAS